MQVAPLAGARIEMDKSKNAKVKAEVAPLAGARIEMASLKHGFA